MRRTAILIMIAMLSCLLVACSGVGEGNGYYVYPEQGETSGQTYLAKCRIPQETLDAMTSEELAQAIVDFPFLVDVFISSTRPLSLEQFADECDAYRELLTRENGKDVLCAKRDEFSVEDGVQSEFIIDALSALILYTEAWSKDLTTEELAEKVTQYPMVTDVLLSSSLPADLSFMQDCEAYTQLVTCEGGKDALIAKVKAMEEDMDDAQEEIVVEALKQIILFEGKWQEQLTEEDKAFLTN